jgi:hypothetical protein
MKTIALLSVLFACFCVYGAESRPATSLPKALLDRKIDSPVGTPGRKKSDSPIGTPKRKTDSVDNFEQLKIKIEQKKSEQKGAQQKTTSSEKK